jgi:hypothetical protein
MVDRMEIKIILATEVMRLTGLSRGEMMEWRGRLEEGKHWVRIPSNKPQKLWAIGWTEAGVAALGAGVGMEELREDLEKGLEKPKEVIGVVKGKFKNNRVILCEIDYEKGKVEANVLVRDSKNFVVGMRVPLRSDGGRWVAAKHPRFGGRW